MLKKDTKELAANAKFYEAYARYDDDKERYEAWEESVARVFDTHRKKFNDKLTPELESLLQYAQNMYNKKRILGAQRALQFGGDQLLAHEFKLYNCTSGYLDRLEFFGEYMYLLLCGAGVGFSVQKHHVAKLPKASPRSNRVVQFIIPDSIEGWAEAIDVLVSSFFEDGAKFPQYSGKKVYFDFSQIRPRGSKISGGFKAPGPEPLRKCIAICEEILTKIAYNGGQIKPIDAYDIAMHIADAVISGGVRRAATIALFSPDDEEMMKAKTGNWYIDNPQRARSNNSVMLVRDETSHADLAKMIESIKQFGEPGFILTENREFTYNPCVEIGMLPTTDDGRTGFQACNLTEINGSQCDTKEKFFDACKAAAITGTIQAGYTNFKYVSEATREIVEKEALLGVSITGWMNNPHILFDENILKEGAEIVKYWNKVVAKLLGINVAARTTCVKPSGNASVLLQTANGIHGEHSEHYLRHVQMNKDTEVAKLFAKKFPQMVEDSVWSRSGTDYCIAFPFVAGENSIFKKDLLGVKQLEYVKKAQQVWVENGTNHDLCRDENLRHNVSNTITVDNWDEVIEYVFDNKKYFAGISFIPMSGDKDYAQAPNAEVKTETAIVNEYGPAALFASGLICHGTDAFNNDLWLAIATANGMGIDITEDSHENSQKKDFVRRFVKFAEANFNGDMRKCSDCLKDVYYLHKWQRIQHALADKDINWVEELTEKVYTDIDTMGAIACSGVKGCEI